jgi:hypothetical protein
MCEKVIEKVIEKVLLLIDQIVEQYNSNEIKSDEYFAGYVNACNDVLKWIRMENEWKRRRG